MAKRLEGKVAVVTGSGRGIGRAVAVALAAEGAAVVVNDIGVELDGSGFSRSPADEVAGFIRAHGGTAVASYGSVAGFGDAREIIETAVRAFGRIDILMNNAGIAKGAPVYELSEKDWDDVLAVHVKGTFNCTRHASPYMKEQKSGRIINVVSRAGLLGSPRAAAYGASKGAIYAFTNVAALDLGPFGVTVNAVNPGATETRMVSQA